MNYSHQFHAGNFADIFKHITLIFCIERLIEKESPIFILDTHCGKSKYDLFEDASIITKEADFGIKKFLSEINYENSILNNYINILIKINKFSEKKDLTKIKYYCGSGYIISKMLRKQDRLALCELKKDEYKMLRKNIFGGNNIFFYNQNGFDLIKSNLPPKEKRGLIFIDPAFEKNSATISNDYNQIINSLQEAYKRFEHGTYIIWYPIIDKEEQILNLNIFYENILNLKFKDITRIIFSSKDKYNQENKMSKCGIIAINLPFTVEDKLKIVFSSENLSIEKINK